MRYWLRFNTLIVAFLLTFFGSFAARIGDQPAEYDLQRSIDRLFKSRVIARASTSVKIIVARTGEVLYERNPQALLTPASTIKLISSATALARLGRHYTFRTVVFTDDTSHEQTVIRGNLYLRGFGDPYLTTEDLRKLSSDLRKQGVTEVLGDVVGDESFFDHASACTGWSGRGYSAIRRPHLSSLTLDVNLMTVTLVPAKKKGAKVRIEFSAGGSFFKVINQCVSVDTRVRYRPTVKAYWGEETCTIRISGSMSIGSRPRTYTLPVESPAWYAAAIFREQLMQEGIQVAGKPRAGGASGGVRELTRNADPIQAVLTGMNKESDNFVAEMVLRTLGAELAGPPGEIEKGVQAVMEFLGEVGISPTSHRIYDGSGISHENAVSANAFTALLQYMYLRKDLFEDFHNTLPYAGVDGTLRGRMVGTDAEGNLHAKTGTLNGVTSLAGYVTNADNELLIFSITSAEFSYGKKRFKSLQDRIGIILANFSRNRYSSN